MKGLIVMYNKDKGYGFVKGEDGQEYHFKDRAIAFGKMPEKGLQCDFEVKSREVKGNKKPQIESLKVLEQAAQTPPPVTHTHGKAFNNSANQNRNDDRIICPYCHKKIVPRIYFLNTSPYASYCPYCGKRIQLFQKWVTYITIAIVAIPLLFVIIAIIFNAISIG